MNRLRRLGLFVCICIAGVARVAHAADQEGLYAQFVKGTIERHYLPRMTALVSKANDLVAGIEALCKTPTADTLRVARARWIDAMLAWESASAVDYGPLITRRSTQRIDFWPVRRSLLAEALKAAPATVAGLGSIGGPAKGIPAIEWLLWEPAGDPESAPTPSDRPALLGDRSRCAYARLVALDVANEARMLSAGFAALGAPGPARPTDKAEDLFAALLNQILSAVEQLMFKKMEMPASGNPSGFPRALSGQTAAAWNAQWSSIRSLLLGETGNDGLVALLRSRGFTAAGDQVQAAANRLTATLGTTSHATPDTAKRAAQEVAAVRTVLRAEVAGGLKIPIRFLDRDHD